MSSHTLDPRAEVVAPVHRALEFLVVRGAASFAVAVLAVLATVVQLSEPWGIVGQAGLPAVLLFVVGARLVHRLADRRPWQGDGVWSRAAEIDRAETWFAALIAVAVPVAWLVGGGAILWNHAGSRSALAEVVGFWLPAGGALWFFATLAWAGDCRERLARAIEASEQQFRAYWAQVGRSSWS